jgi:hypothetical protein
VYRGPNIEVALSYRFARANLGEKWLFLDTAIKATDNPVEVPRTAIAVRTPQGELIHLASQAAFANQYGSLQSDIMRANVNREPLNYLVPRRFHRLGFFARPGYALAFPVAWLDYWFTDYGRLYFELPNGVQRGNYQLVIDLPNSEVVIPFAL